MKDTGRWATLAAAFVVATLGAAFVVCQRQNLTRSSSSSNPEHIIVDKNGDLKDIHYPSQKQQNLTRPSNSSKPADIMDRTSGLTSDIVEARLSTSVILHLAGLEGTGHHFYLDFFHTLCTEALRSRRCTHPQKWSFGIRDGRKNITEDDARRFQESAARPPGAHLLLLDSGSFPQGLVGHARRQVTHPDERSLVKAAALAGFVARVIVTFRNAFDVLMADCIHRRFESCVMQAKTLITNAKALAEQLRHIGPRYFACAKYGNETSMRSALVWGVGFSDHVADTFARTWTAQISTKKVRQYESKATKEVRQLSTQMQPAFKQIERLCGW